MSSTVWIIGAAIAYYVIFLASRRRGLPPGPPRSFYGLGDNTRDLPSQQVWKKFTAWNQQYGPVMSFYLGRKPVIVLGSAQAAWDLLDKRSEIYSSRPRSIMANEILSGGMRGITMPYGRKFRNWRFLLQAGMGSAPSLAYRDLQSVESKLLLGRLLEETLPLQYRDHLRLFQTSVIFTVAYGRRVKSLDDKIVTANVRSAGTLGKYQVPGRYLVESWHILLYLPKSLQWFRREAEFHRQEDIQLYTSLMNDVKVKMEKGTAPPSMATRALQKQGKFGLNDLETAYALATPYVAGVETVVFSIEVFLMAMLLFPSVMRKAQEEIDSVVGHDKMPEFSDMESLPYVGALIKEVTRWRTVAPTGFPHLVIEDDVYEGMSIPKGTTVFSNIYAICRDPSMFPKPDEFRPERFLNISDPKLVKWTISFGFGRRICPGMHVAYQSMFIVVSRLLWAFNLTPPTVTCPDGSKQAVLPDPDDFLSGLIARPAPFECIFDVRKGRSGVSVEDIIRREVEWAETEAVRWE